MGKPIGSIVTLTYTAWNGPEPKANDCLKTKTGRLYEIIEVSGRRLKCRIIHPLSRLADDCNMFDWVWNKRVKK